MNAENMQRFCDCLRQLPKKKVYGKPSSTFSSRSLKRPESFGSAFFKVCKEIGIIHGRNDTEDIETGRNWLGFSAQEMDDFAELTEVLSKTLTPPEIAKYLEHFYLGEELI